ncbi:VOC family protein [Sphingomonas sp. LR61]|uniref:VOC family protein n=1 Tax=Sphingomonas sp. LR61 TaxID=3050234 RepID=UPI002FE2EB9C
MHAITLAVADVARSADFYRALLGIEGSGVIGTEYPPTETEAGGTTAMFTLDDGLIVSVYGRDDMAKDSGVALADGPAATIGHFVDSQADAEAFLDRARIAGATMLAPRTRGPGACGPGSSRTRTGTCGRSSRTPAAGLPRTRSQRSRPTQTPSSSATSSQRSSSCSISASCAASFACNSPSPA